MLKRLIKDIRRYYRYSIVSAKAQLKSEVANSFLNWIWWILDPICFMLIYTFMFGYVFKAREPFFPIFIFVGLSMWEFFNHTLTNSVKIVKKNKALVSKVYFPKYILIITQIWVNGFKMLISFSLVFTMMLFSKVPLTWNVLYFFPVLLILIIFSFGCSCYLLHYGVYVEDLANVVKIVLRVVFYLTGIFYNVATRIPEYGDILNKFNPVAFLLSSMRNCLLYSQTPARKMMLFWFAVSVVLSISGIGKIYKEENSYVKSI